MQHLLLMQLGAYVIIIHIIIIIIIIIIDIIQVRR